MIFNILAYIIVPFMGAVEPSEVMSRCNIILLCSSFKAKRSIATLPCSPVLPDLDTTLQQQANLILLIVEKSGNITLTSGAFCYKTFTF